MESALEIRARPKADLEARDSGVMELILKVVGPSDIEPGFCGGLWRYRGITFMQNR